MRRQFDALTDGEQNSLDTTLAAGEATTRVTRPPVTARSCTSRTVTGSWSASGVTESGRRDPL